MCQSTIKSCRDLYILMTTPRCISMHFTALRSLTQPCMTAYCILHNTYDPGISPGSANQCILGDVYLRSNLSRILMTTTRFPTQRAHITHPSTHHHCSAALLAGSKVLKLLSAKVSWFQQLLHICPAPLGIQLPTTWRAYPSGLLAIPLGLTNFHQSNTV